MKLILLNFIVIWNQIVLLILRILVQLHQQTYNLTFVNEEDDARYFEAKFIYESYTIDLPNYEQEMANWVDGPAEWSLVERNGMSWTNLERITLSNGQRAWKTDQGVFYPGPDGMPGYNKVSEEYLE